MSAIRTTIRTTTDHTSTRTIYRVWVDVVDKTGNIHITDPLCVYCGYSKTDQERIARHLIVDH